MEEMILIEKYSPTYPWWEGIVKYNRITELTPEQLVQQYQGFEGDLITYFSREDHPEKLASFYQDCSDFDLAP